MFASILGHIGDGNFHESIMYDKTNPKEVQKIERVVHNMVDRALLMEGTCTASGLRVLFQLNLLLSVMQDTNISG